MIYISKNRIAIYLWICCLILNCHSVYSVGKNDIHTEIICIIATILLAIIINGSIEAKTFKLVMGWILFNIPITIYSSMISDYALTYLTKYVVFPCLVFIILYMNKDNSILFLDAFVNIICTISIVSLFFYFFSTITHIIKPTGKFYILWAPARWVSSFYGLYFEISDGHIFAYKNSAIFCESTIFAALLGVALSLELFIERKNKKRHVFKIILMIITILSTFSSATYLALVVCAFGIVWKNYQKIVGNRFTRLIIFGVVVAMGGIAISVAGIIYLRKKHAIGQSYLVRMDDFKVAWKILRRNPLMGIGFGTTGYAKHYMSTKRIKTGNFGQSSDFAALVSSGGLYFISSYFVGFRGLSMLVDDRVNRILFLIASLIIFSLTRIGSTLLFISWISIGVTCFFRRMQEF